MRPINRGDIPLNNEGELYLPDRYQGYRGHLIERLGSYCSYCERPLSHSIAVEHIQPKINKPELEISWTNLLLACTNCNSIKNDKEVLLTNYFWPDQDNTSRAFVYSSAGAIRPNTNLDQNLVDIAINTINLTGLDREPSDDLSKNPEVTDRRWRERRTAWERANRAHYRLRQNDTSFMREQIIDTALEKGFFSIWMTVFNDDYQMKRDLIMAFKGTAEECYNSECYLVARPHGLI